MGDQNKNNAMVEAGEGAAVKTVVEGQETGTTTNPEDTTSTGQNTGDGTATEAAADDKSGKTEGSDNADATPAASKKKWHEEDGAFPFVAGDHVEILSGPDLIGRLAVVIKPSNKTAALKARLVSKKDGSLQGCEVVLDLDRITKTDKRFVEKVEQSTEATEPDKNSTSVAS